MATVRYANLDGVACGRAPCGNVFRQIQQTTEPA